MKKTQPVYTNDPLGGSDSQTQTPQSMAALSQKVTIKGNYLLGKKLGEGSFGRVHLAKHLPTGEKVAIKIIPKTNMTAMTQKRVKNELNILKSIRHRHIMQLYQVLETQKSLLLATQYMSGGELFHRILKQKRLSQQQACSYFQQLIAAVEYLHRNKIAHRDIKPQNILLDNDQQAKLIDFGLSSSFCKSGTLSECSGSPCYAAPEVIKGDKAYDPTKSDIWSCGVVLFVMLCGYLPFCDSNMSLLFDKIKNGKFKTPPSLSAAARNLIAGMLVVQPNSRMQIQDIKNHEWYHKVPPKLMYGVGLDQKIGIDSRLFSAHQKLLEVPCAQLQKWLFSKEKNKHTATYHLLMKKLVREGELVPSYIGNCNFNPNLVLSSGKQQQLIPQVEDIQASYSAEEGPNVGCAQFGEPHVSDLSQEQISEMTCSIWKKIMKKNSQNPLQMMLQVEEVNLMQKKILQMKESKFYADNKLIRKRQINLSKAVKQRIKSKDELASIYYSGKFVKKGNKNQYLKAQGPKNKSKQLPKIHLGNRPNQSFSDQYLQKLAILKKVYGSDVHRYRKTVMVGQTTEYKKSIEKGINRLRYQTNRSMGLKPNIS